MEPKLGFELPKTLMGAHRSDDHDHQILQNHIQLWLNDMYPVEKLESGDNEATLTEEKDAGSQSECDKLRKEIALLKDTLTSRDADLRWKEEEQCNSQLICTQQLDARDEELQSTKARLHEAKRHLTREEQEIRDLRADLESSQAATDTARNVANARYSQEQVNDLVRKIRKEGEARMRERIEKDRKEVEVRLQAKAANDMKAVGEQYSARLQKRDKMLDRAEEQFDAHRIPYPWQKKERGPRK